MVVLIFVLWLEVVLAVGLATMAWAFVRLIATPWRKRMDLIGEGCRTFWRRRLLGPVLVVFTASMIYAAWADIPRVVHYRQYKEIRESVGTVDADSLPQVSGATANAQ